LLMKLQTQYVRLACKAGKSLDRHFLRGSAN
jgi:hypothetical protein